MQCATALETSWINSFVLPVASTTMGCAWTYKSRLWKEQVGSVPIAKCARTASKWDWKGREEDGVRSVRSDFKTSVYLPGYICYHIILSSRTNPCVGSVIMKELRWNSSTLYPHSYHSLGRFWRAAKPFDVFLLLDKRVFLKFTRLTNQKTTFGPCMYCVLGRRLALGLLFYFVISFRGS